MPAWLIVVLVLAVPLAIVAVIDWFGLVRPGMNHRLRAKHHGEAMERGGVNEAQRMDLNGG